MAIAVTTLLDIRSNANAWLMDHLPDRFVAGVPEHDNKAGVWRVPAWLSYPQIEALGPVGELIFDEIGRNITHHTSIGEMKACAVRLYEENREQIEAPLP